MSRWYRYDDDATGNTIKLYTYDSFRLTPKGEWVRSTELGGGAYFIRYTSARQPFRLSTEEALQLYLDRKAKQRTRLWNQILQVEALMARAITMQNHHEETTTND